MKRKAICLLCALILLLPLPVSAQDEITTTVLIYMCGSDLETESSLASQDLQEMIAAGIPENSHLTVLVETGGAKEWHMSAVSNQKNQRFQVTENGLIARADYLGRKNMGASGTLTDFLQWSMMYAPADRTILIIWDHGGGPLEGSCIDEMHQNDTLTLPEMTHGLKTGLFGKKLDAIVFDCCLMASAEVAQSLVPYADYMAASQEIITSTGLDYTVWIKALLEDPGMDIQSLLCLKADSMIASFVKNWEEGLCFSVVDLSKMQALTEALDAFGRSAGEILKGKKANRILTARKGLLSFGEFMADAEPTDLVDIQMLCDAFSKLLPAETKALSQALNDAVCYNKTMLATRDRASGLSVFLPRHTIEMNPDYLEIYPEIAGMNDYASFAVELGKNMQKEGEEKSGGLLNGLGNLISGFIGKPEPSPSPTPQPEEKSPYPGLWAELSEPVDEDADPYPRLWEELNGK